jgi:hypothetical protein
MKLQALQTKLNQSCKKKNSLYIYRYGSTDNSCVNVKKITYLSSYHKFPTTVVGNFINICWIKFKIGEKTMKFDESCEWKKCEITNNQLPYKEVKL